MQDYDKTFLERLQTATAGIDLTAGELTRQDLFKLWGFLETLKNIFEAEIRDAAKIEGSAIRDSVTGNNAKWAAEIRELQQKINREAGEV